MGFLRYYLLFITFLCMVSLNTPGSSADTTSVSASWSSLKSAAATAEIRFLKTTMTVEKTGLSPKQVTDIVDGLEAGPGDDLFSEVIHKMNPALEKRFSEHDQEQQSWSLWEERTLFFDGFSERSIGDNDEHLRTENLHLMHNFKSRAVECYERGQCPFFYYGLEWLLGVPPPHVLDDADVVDASAASLKLDLGNGRHIVVDPENHLPIRDETIGGDGSISKLIFYRNQTSYPGGVTLPAVKLQVSFQRGVAKHVMLSAILDAEFNLDIPAEKFEMPVKEGTVLADLRNGERRSRRVKNDVSNAGEYFIASETVTTRQAAPVVHQGFGWKSLLLIGNGIFLIVLGVFFWRRSS